MLSFPSFRFFRFKSYVVAERSHFVVVVNGLKHSEFVVLESQKVRVHFVGYGVSGNLLSKSLKHW